MKKLLIIILLFFCIIGYAYGGENITAYDDAPIILNDCIGRWSFKHKFQ